MKKVDIGCIRKTSECYGFNDMILINNIILIININQAVIRIFGTNINLIHLIYSIIQLSTM